MPSYPISGAYLLTSSPLQEKKNEQLKIAQTNRSVLLILPIMNLPISYHDVFGVKKHNFNEIALEIFHFQARNNTVYNQYLSLIGVNTETISSINQIPHMPIEFFKTHVIKTGNWTHTVEKRFESSSTTGLNTSKHYYEDLSWYRSSYTKTFEHFYGHPSEWCFLALLPNYLERSNSSLITMVTDLIDLSGHPSSGFYLYNHDELFDQLVQNEENGQKTVLFGVSFGLLDFAEKISYDFKNLIVLETGGMKGRRTEITRNELHEQLQAGFGSAPIHSEYGMTELFSQGYSLGDQLFETPNWMKVSLTQLDDPFASVAQGKNGLINVIDLANLNTCCFIATSDIGRLHKDGRFEVLGRFDHSEQRGCNLLLS